MQKNDPIQRNDSFPLGGLLVGVGASLVVLYALYAWLPYATGYGDTRASLLAFANWVWKGSEDWTHCYLVPVAVGVMVYLDRKRLAGLTLTGSWTGLGVIVFGLLIYWVGYRVDNVYIGYGSFQIVLGGLILWLFGWKWMLALAFPWAFMVFLYPLPFLDNLIAFPLRMVMSNAAVGVLDGIGIEVVRQGTGILSAPDQMLGIPAGQKFSVDVADPCSGIRSLFALMMVSALYGHFVMKTWWQKVIIFLCSMPLAVLGNLVRILILTLGTIAFGSEFAIGRDALDDPSWFHMGAGYAVFAVALGGMVGIGWVLMNFQRAPTMVRSFGDRLRQETSPVVARAAEARGPGRQGDRVASRSRDEY